MTPLDAAESSSARERPLLLLVEDHLDTRQMYAEFLSMAFEVVTAGDGDQALDLMRGRRPDLLITDLSLPGMDGFDLIAHVRGDPSLRSVPILCLSGYGGHAHEQRARDAGCDRMLQKPCLPETLAAAAADLIEPFRDRRVQA